ncbi:MAG: hypothetical protein NC248_11135, partial [Bacteroides sp.]|nr:hypothetical protein [Bacteroides sp.]
MFNSRTLGFMQPGRIHIYLHLTCDVNIGLDIAMRTHTFGCITAARPQPRARCAKKLSHGDKKWVNSPQPCTIFAQTNIRHQSAGEASRHGSAAITATRPKDAD